ncbi:MAG: M20/M25/M40 family metallo-hydrolase [Chloroflexota bacterium]
MTISQAVQYLLDLLPIQGPPAKESRVAAEIKNKLMAMGVSSDHIHHDQAQTQSEYGGEVGNLIVQFSGRIDESRLMFSTHMDTVPNAVGCQPHLDEVNQRIINEAEETALGGDNRLGCAALLNLARELIVLNGDHPPVTLVFFIQEEVGLVGARGLDLSLLGDAVPTMCINLDGGRSDQIVTAVIGTERFTIDLTGIPAHGGYPDNGVSTAIIQAKAIAELEQQGWHGRIKKPDGEGTANVGIVQGGQGSNVVMPSLHILAEARSHDTNFRRKIIATWQQAFEQAVQDTVNPNGQTGSVSFGSGPTYDAFALADDAPVVEAVLQAAKQCGIEASLVSNDGGMDANWIVAHGIPAVTIGVGQRQVHTTEEWIDLPDFEQACQLIIAVAKNAG